MKKNTFLLCGSVGWCLEILWTGLHSLFQGEFTMKGNSSLLMFPIYGFACLIRPFSKFCCGIPRFFRGCIYTVFFFVIEYTTGRFLKYHHICPWDYSDCPWNIQGIIRLDFIPVWFLTSLVYEKILDDYA